ncbi:hypothetical protein NTE_02113 [Candidatus Nitrososphaera evergladensis SR1]|uniref:Uncharacterized protein n=1 Tax=Candidatus Nitrososphaera evergladensis SR1 TaxID=1459636 RepID=A0A075MSN8_9ARCH|nr:hypothetical protein NTE_02113 [Candidatus Nitrososphaera evergladensis SR1]
MTIERVSSARGRNDKPDFRVKVSYRKGKTRGTIAWPATILDAWGYPEYLVFAGNGDGSAIVRPVAKEKVGVTE